MNQSTLEQLRKYPDKIVAGVARSGEPFVITENGIPRVAVVALRDKNLAAEAELDEFVLAGAPADVLAAQLIQPEITQQNQTWTQRWFPRLSQSHP